MSGTQGATFTSNLDYSNPASIFLTSPQGWGSPPGGQDGYANYPDAKDELMQFRLSAKKALDSAVNSVEVGVDYTDRSKNLDVNEFFLSVRRGSVGASGDLMPSAYVARVLIGAGTAAFGGRRLPAAEALAAADLAPIGTDGAVGHDIARRAIGAHQDHSAS